VEIKIADVKKLREKTGAGMMDCKKSLEEAGGDFAKAEKILKENGLAAAAKRSGRATTEGTIVIKGAGKKAVILELSCETDFVARNQDFNALGAKLADVILAKGYTSVNDELTAMTHEAIAVIKENITLRRFTVVTAAETEDLVSYIHGGGSHGVIVKIASNNPSVLANDKVKETAFDCALHITAFNPMYLSREKVSPAYIAEQESIFTKQAEGLDKPAKVIEGIIKGKVNKHLSEICFLDQPFVKDDKRSVSQVLKDLGKELGADVTVSDFIYFRVGEDLEA